MPVLKTILPALMEDEDLKDTRAYKLRNRQVTAIKLTTGAPCSSHDGLFEPWPGPETDVSEWYVLDNGYAVGKGGHADGTCLCPVVLLKAESD